MSLLTRRHEPDEHDGRDVHDDGVLDEVVDGVDGVGDSAEDAEDEDGGWWIFNCSRREVVEPTSCKSKRGLCILCYNIIYFFFIINSLIIYSRFR